MSVLVLLVGRNPAPNWVVFQSLAVSGAPADLRPTSVVLIHSPQTAIIAERLRTNIAKNGVPARQIELGDPRDAVTMQRDIELALEQHSSGAPVHLNYTGGTKQMAVSAYSATKEAERRLGRADYTYSYLDPANFCLRFDNRERYPPAPLDLRGLVNVPLGELFRLHGRDWANGANGSTKRRWTDSCAAVWELMAGPDEGRAAYGNWLKTAMSQDTGSVRKLPRLDDEHGFVFPSDGLLAPVMAAMCSEANLPAGQASLSWKEFFERQGAFNKDQRESIWSDFAGFFHGKWLEGWLHHRLTSLVRDDFRGKIERNVVVEPSTVGSTAELDVVLTYGYQLFVFSCTTSQSLGLVKSKGFEVRQRAAQFGGDEARAILVSLLPQFGRRDDDASVANLRADLTSEDDQDSRMRVWGIRELRDLDHTWGSLLEEERLA